MSWGAIQVWVVGGLESSFRTSPPLLLNLDLDSLWCNLHFFSAVENLGRGSVSTLRSLALHIWIHHSLEQTWTGSKCARWQQWGMTWEEADGDWELFKKKNKNLNGCARHPSSSQRPNRMSIKIGYSLRNLTWRSILSVPFKNVLPPLRYCRISANSSSLTIWVSPRVLLLVDKLSMSNRTPLLGFWLVLIKETSSQKSCIPVSTCWLFSFHPLAKSHFLQPRAKFSNLKKVWWTFDPGIWSQWSRSCHLCLDLPCIHLEWVSTVGYPYWFRRLPGSVVLVHKLSMRMPLFCWFNLNKEILECGDCFSKAGLFFERYWNVVITSLGQGSISSILDKRNLTLIRMFSCPYKVLHRLTSRQPFLSQGLNNIWQNYKTAWNWRSLNAPKQLQDSF